MARIPSARPALKMPPLPRGARLMRQLVASLGHNGKAQVADLITKPFDAGSRQTRTISHGLAMDKRYCAEGIVLKCEMTSDIDWFVTAFHVTYADQRFMSITERVARMGEPLDGQIGYEIALVNVSLSESEMLASVGMPLKKILELPKVLPPIHLGQVITDVHMNKMMNVLSIESKEAS
jgi:hypothetical protein